MENSFDSITLIGEELQFYGTFVNGILNSNTQVDENKKKKFNNNDFRSYIKDRYIDYKIVKEMSPYVVDCMKKSQTLHADAEDFYVATDDSSSTYYVCYKTLFMADIDSIQGLDSIHLTVPHCRCQVEQVVENVDKVNPMNEPSRTATWMRYKCKGTKGCTYRYRIYKSRNGAHIFCISHPMDYKSDLSIQISLECMTDYFYAIFCYLRGWSVRVNRKFDEHANKIIYTYIGDVVNGKIGTVTEMDRTGVLPDDHLNTLVDLHIELTGVFRNVIPRSH